MDITIIHNPTYIELDDAYRSLSRLQEIEVKTNNLHGTLRDMEKIGFVAIQIINTFPKSDLWTLIATKGKHGPCYFSGSTAAYTGEALAALDDDLHLLPAHQVISVCDKTCSIYQLPAYKKRIDCKVKNIESENAKNSITDGDQDDFDSLVEKLIDQLKAAQQITTNRKMLFYPGPFRMLILQDGTIVRRGKWNAVSSNFADLLLRKEGLILSENRTSEPPVFLQDQYKQEGVSALMDKLVIQNKEPELYETDFSSLHALSTPLRKRLLQLLNENKKYFVLVGSDASDRSGCCPSEEVTEANALVKHGILNAFSEPLQGDSCPVTIYSIKNELSVQENGFDVEINTKFRNQLKERLVKSRGGARSILKWVLLTFVVISTILAARKSYQLRTVPIEVQSYNQLKPLIDGQIQLVFFHNEKRCYQCLEMEKFADDVLNEFHTLAIKEKKLSYKTIIIDDPANQPLVNEFGIFAAAFVVMEFDGEKLIYARVLREAAELYRDEAAFKAYFENELSGMLTSNHD